MVVSDFRSLRRDRVFRSLFGATVSGDRNPVPNSKSQADVAAPRLAARRLDVRFEPPLPPVEHLAAGEVSSHFTVSLDGFANLISGEVVVHRDDNAATLDWRFEAPAWTRAWGLLTTTALGGDAVTHIELKPMPPK